MFPPDWSCSTTESGRLLGTFPPNTERPFRPFSRRQQTQPPLRQRTSAPDSDQSGAPMRRGSSGTAERSPPPLDRQWSESSSSASGSPSAVPQVATAIGSAIVTTVLFAVLRGDG